MNRLKRLHNRHSGERCVLVANGPSLNQMDLRFLCQETVIGMNKIFLGFSKFHFYPRYYVAINGHVIEQARAQIQEMNCIKFIGDRKCNGNLRENALTYLVNTSHPPARFSQDLAQGIHEGWTVTYAALQIAYYLGFSEVILIGLDHRYIYNGNPNELVISQTDDINHFSPDYFGRNQAWQNPDLEKSEESYCIARAEYEKAGKQIIDATLNGACNIFDKGDYKTIFGLK